jgi:hypothetical protein
MRRYRGTDKITTEIFKEINLIIRIGAENPGRRAK